MQNDRLDRIILIELAQVIDRLIRTQNHAIYIDHADAVAEARISTHRLHGKIPQQTHNSNKGNKKAAAYHDPKPCRTAFLFCHSGEFSTSGTVAWKARARLC